jgi:hypothetical protein
MEKELRLPNHENFVGDIPWHVAIVTTVNKKGEADICPVGMVKI